MVGESYSGIVGFEPFVVKEAVGNQLNAISFFIVDILVVVR